MTGYVSTTKAAQRLGICTKTVRALIAVKELDAYPQTTRLAGTVHAWKVAEDSIDGYIRRQQHRVSA
jgi:hypothetical protein